MAELQSRVDSGKVVRDDVHQELLKIEADVEDSEPPKPELLPDPEEIEEKEDEEAKKAAESPVSPVPVRRKKKVKKASK